MSDERPTTDDQVWLDEQLDSDAQTSADASEGVAVKTAEPEAAEDAATEDAAASDATIEETMETVDRVSGLISSLETTAIAPAKASVLRAILKNVRSSIDNAITLLDGERGEQPSVKTEVASSSSDPVKPTDDKPKRDHEAVEGVFNGSAMVGDDGKEYAVPPNYASKSKLVEGDMLKLYIGDRGNFIFKQIGPIERQRLIGVVSFDQENGQYTVLAAGRSWKILKASVTYFKSEVGDEAVILVPKNAPSRYAAVENIIHRNPDASMDSSR